MDDWLDVRLDSGDFARQVAAMRAELEGSLGQGADRAGRSIEAALLRATKSGKLGFDDLKSAALAALEQIAAGVLKSGVAALGGGGLLSAAAGLLGAPGRATGGPVSPGRAYRVGERGPELFVPTASGAIVAPTGAAPRDVRVAITVNAAAADMPRALERSGRQVARAVRAAISEG